MLMREWVADRDGEIGSVEIDGVTSKVIPAVDAKAGRLYLVKPSGDGVVSLKRAWVTPAIVEHDDGAIRSGSTSGPEAPTGGPTPAQSTTVNQT